jgi:hypothetical protein
LTSGLTDKRAIGEATRGSAPPGVTHVGQSVEIGVIFATAPAGQGGPAALAPLFDGTMLGRLADQLIDLGVPRILVLTRPEWQAEIEQAVPADVEVRASAALADDLQVIGRLAADGGKGLLLSYGDIVTHGEALAGLLAEPRRMSSVLAERQLSRHLEGRARGPARSRRGGRPRARPARGAARGLARGARAQDGGLAHVAELAARGR